MATFRLRLLVWKETHYEKLSSRGGKTHTNLVLFQRVQDFIDCSNFNF